MGFEGFSREELLQAGEPRFAKRRVVRFQDVDAAGVVFFPRYLEYFHDAFIEILAEHGHDWSRELHSGIVAPIKHAEADYLAPLRFGDGVRIELVRARLEPTQVTVGHRIVRDRDGRAASVGQTLHVAVDAETFQRESWPDGLRRVFAVLDSG
jgi:YbgC/YbaW family acyl-CoA thioester hydrolase